MDYLTLNFKKGLNDAMTIAIFLFILVVMIVVMRMVFTQIISIPLFSSSPELNQIMASGTAYFNSLDFSFALILLCLNVYALIMLFFLESNPILFIIHALAVPITIYVSTIISNTFESFAASITTFNIAAAYPIMYFIMMHLPKIEFGFDIIGGILLFATMRMIR